MRLLFIDTETGGTNPREDALLEVTLLVFEEGETLAERTWKIHSGSKDVKYSALAINKIDIHSHNMNAIYRLEAALEIVEFLDKWFPDGPATLAGHNVSFDRDFLQELLEESDYPFSEYISHRLLDVMSILNFMVDAGILPESVLSSSGAFKHFGIEPEGRHTSKGDVEATLLVYRYLKELLPHETF